MSGGLTARFFTPEPEHAACTDSSRVMQRKANSMRAAPSPRKSEGRQPAQSGTSEVDAGGGILPLRFRKPKRVGGGAMGLVFKARDLETGLTVAVKVLRQREHKERFLQEAGVLSTIQHRNVVRHVAHGIGP